MECSEFIHLEGFIASKGNIIQVLETERLYIVESKEGGIVTTTDGQEFMPHTYRIVLPVTPVIQALYELYQESRREASLLIDDGSPDSDLTAQAWSEGELEGIQMAMIRAAAAEVYQISEGLKKNER